MDYHRLKMSERSRNNAYREICFDSKPIYEIDCGQARNCRRAAAAEVRAMKDEIRRH